MRRDNKLNYISKVPYDVVCKPLVTYNFFTNTL